MCVPSSCKSHHAEGEICAILPVAFGSLCLLRLRLISLSRQNEPSFFLKLRLSVGQDTCRDSTSLKFVFTKSVHLSPNLPAIPTSLSETASSHTRKVTDEKVCAPAFSAVWLPGAMRVETAHGDHGRFATIGGDGPQAAVRWCDGREDDPLSVWRVPRLRGPQTVPFISRQLLHPRPVWMHAVKVRLRAAGVELMQWVANTSRLPSGDQSGRSCCCCDGTSVVT